MSISRGWAISLLGKAEWLLAQDCFLCAAPAGDDLLCRACCGSLPRMPAALCPVCALPTTDSDICGACLRKAPRFDATAAVFRYEFPLDSLIQSLKYSHHLASAGFLGRMLAQVALPFRPDLIVPVPLSPARLAERGFNQALEIARPLLRTLDLPVELEHIHRRRDTSPQAALPWKQRAKNVRHAFECELDLSGRAVLVVDDVMTTGATLDELARTLKAHGAARVGNLVVARTLRD